VSHDEHTSEIAGIDGPSEPAARTERRILIVEPEELVRWSLVTYLTRWFAVYSAAAESTAHRVLDSDIMDAVVISDDLKQPGVEEIESHALDRNPAVQLVRMVTARPPAPPADGRTSHLEKPFQLARLAELLGIQDARRRRERKEPPCSSKTT